MNAVTNFLCLFIFPSVVLAVSSDRLKVKVTQHQSCGRGKAEGIIFPDYRQAPVIPEQKRGETWYTIRGTVTVNKEISDQLYIYVESKNGTLAQPIECHNARNGCGGIGSCVYCDVCKSLTDDRVRSNVEILSKGYKLDCSKSLKKGLHSDVSLSFLPPNLSDFLRAENIDRKAWNDIIGKRGATVYVTIYIFDRDVSQLSPSALRSKATTYDHVICCHRLVVNFYSDNDQKRA